MNKIIEEKVRKQIRNQIRNQVFYQFRNQVNNQVWNNAGRQLQINVLSEIAMVMKLYHE